ncbi:hypothetical protein XM38_007890 [Halomicronema hongdechloris C2206]|uniref:Lipoprotein n=1 Tax=Halomicronema hongdechloris C2206 TaxID=1641165 RepID=A0A1Z3HHR7_9CYAN|nr:hypothetical protein [Halomicronema hongdechloris]ASC69859.1 hypothetical protein XM38_007890 [Halomicronema hongdechloris C2206]
MKTIRSLRLSQRLPILLGVALTACAQITVTGLTQGEQANQTITVNALEIKRGRIDTLARVQTFQGQPAVDSINELAIQLSITEANNPPDFSETYYYLAISSPKEAILGGTTGDPNYVPNQIGKLTFLTLNQGDNRVEAAPQIGDAHAGASWLARVEADDRTIPWSITEGDNCFLLEAEEEDCFDMETLSRLLFETLADSIEQGMRNDIPAIQSIRHRLHFVPRVSHPAIGLNNRPAKGFGFIYFAQINVPGANFQVYIPINFLFIANVNQYILVVDPLELDTQDQKTIAQIYVKENIAGGIDLNLTEQIIRDQLIDQLQAAPLPVLIPGIDFSEALLTAMNGAAGNPSQLSDDFDILLSPSGENRDLATTILWEQLVPGNILPRNQVDLFFLE